MRLLLTSHVSFDNFISFIKKHRQFYLTHSLTYSLWLLRSCVVHCCPHHRSLLILFANIIFRAYSGSVASVMCTNSRRCILILRISELCRIVFFVLAYCFFIDLIMYQSFLLKPRKTVRFGNVKEKIVLYTVCDAH